MMRERKFGTRANGQDVIAYELTSETKLRAVVLNQGAILQALYLPDGRNVALGFESWEAYETDASYIGRIIGPNANRISGAKFEIDDLTFDLSANDGLHNLHSGPNGFDAQLWDVQRNENSLELTHRSPDGHDGFPGDIDVRLTISVADNTLRLDMEATANKPTPVNMTWHPYWNLSGNSRIDGHDLQIQSEYRTELRVIKPIPLRNTRFDFHPTYPIGSVQIDENYADVSSTTLISNLTKLCITSSLPDMQVYTGDHLPVPRSGMAIEPQFRPNDINISQKSLLQPGDIYRYWIEYQFSTG